MKALEFPVRTSTDGKLELPENLCASLPPNRVVRLIILLPDPTDSSDDSLWSRLTADQFFAGYSEADAAYDKV